MNLSDFEKLFFILTTTFALGAALGILLSKIINCLKSRNKPKHPYNQWLNHTKEILEHTNNPKTQVPKDQDVTKEPKAS